MNATEEAMQEYSEAFHAFYGKWPLLERKGMWVRFANLPAGSSYRARDLLNMADALRSHTTRPARAEGDGDGLGIA